VERQGPRVRAPALTAGISTIGHSTHSADELIEILRAHAIELVVDVRTVPRSRHNPQFDRSVLPSTLEAAGIAYEHEPALGGLRKPRPDSPHTGWKNASFRGYADHMDTEAFARGLDRLIELSRERSTAILCAEAVPWRCHRSLIADALVARGIEVRHLLSAQSADAHRPTPFARVVGTRVTYPGLDTPDVRE
jgi:uncharacterized protein (DUF488 family)